MKTKPTAHLLTAILLSATCISGVVMAKKKSVPQPAPVALNNDGQQHLVLYTSQLEKLKADLIPALPKIDQQKITAYTKALAAEVQAKTDLETAKKGLQAITSAKGLVDHAKGKWIGGADKAIATAKMALTKAKSKEERDAAQKQLADAEKGREDGLAALKERQANLDKVTASNKNADQLVKQAEQALSDAKVATLNSVKDLGIMTHLSSDKLDGKLATYTFIAQATPQVLAAFAQQGGEQKKMLDSVLAAEPLLIDIAVADGPSNGNYTNAIQIFHDISNTALKNISKSDVKSPTDLATLERLALAISLEHATPIGQRNAVADKDAPAFVDPVKRFIHFKDAFLKGELDPAFKDLSVWDLRMVVDGEEPDEILTWGREMLRNYRPDHVTTPDYRWRYVAAVRSDVPYGSQDNQYDQDELQFFQNILKNGGICGRRAFFGRFILRAFGIPTIARPQKGHAALAHWTPDGWVICLGAGWGSGWTKTVYQQDTDFLASTQARSTGSNYLPVKRAQWIGNLYGEQPVYGLVSKNAPGLWYGLSLYIQKSVIESANAKTLEAVGQDIAEATETKEKVLVTEADLADQDRKIMVNPNGTITIPAVATTNPTKSTGKIIFMNSHDEGKQLHYGPSAKHQNFEYTVEAIKAGKYQLTANIVTPSWRQNFLLTVNGSGEPTKIELPFTLGKWETTQPVTIELKQGQNTLTFSREGNTKGISIKDFTLTPLI